MVFQLNELMRTRTWNKNKMLDGLMQKMCTNLMHGSFELHSTDTVVISLSFSILVHISSCTAYAVLSVVA